VVDVYASDCEDDDTDSGNIRRLLAAATRLLCGCQCVFKPHPPSVDSTRLHRYLLVRYE